MSLLREEKLSDYTRSSVVIGKGGQARVYRYIYPPTNEVFAVKILSSKIFGQDDWSDQEDRSDHGDTSDNSKGAVHRLREAFMTLKSDHVS